MGLIASTLKLASVRNFAASVPVWQSGIAQLPDSNYQTFAREGYMKNELVYACVEELSTSAAEPVMMAKTGDRWVHSGPIIDLLNHPNPFMDRFEFWATIIMYRSLAGNAYILKVRSGAGRVVELWLMRPDRVKVVPSRTDYISHYTYDVGGGEVIRLPADDVIHIKTRHPVNDWYGMPPLMAISGRTDIDNWMKDFVKSAFQNGGMPGAVLSIKQKVTQEQKDDIRNRFRGNFSGPQGWHELLVLDNTEASYTPMSMPLGQRGLVIPELDEIEEARIPMAFGVPQSLIGTRTSYQNGGYANKRAEEQHFWTGTLIPLYRELAGPLNLRLAPDFPRISEVAFDVSDVWALQDDLDKVHSRARENARAGIWSVEEAREVTGLNARWAPDATFLVPSATPPMAGTDLEDPVLPEPVTPPQLPPGGAE